MILTVLLTILKIIGWLLLIILGLILLVLLLVIFCPIGYRLKGNLHREIKESGAEGSGSWLFSAVGGGAVLESFQKIDPKIYIRILKWRKFLGGEEEEAHEDEKSAEEFLIDLDDEDESTVPSDAGESSPAENSGALPAVAEKEKAAAASEIPETSEKAEIVEKAEDVEKAEIAEKTESPESDGTSEVSSEQKKENPLQQKLKKLSEKIEEKKKAKQEKKAKKEQASSQEDDPEKTPKKKFTGDDLEVLISRILDKMDLAQDKIDMILEKVDGALEMADQKIDDFEEKLDQLGSKLDEYLPIIQDPGNQQALLHVLREVFYIIRSLLPYRLDADLEFSAGSPDTTGKILGILAVIPLTHKKKFSVVPDFEAEKFYAEGMVEIFGKICIYKLVGALFRLLLDKNVRKCIKLALKMKKGKSR